MFNHSVKTVIKGRLLIQRVPSNYQHHHLLIIPWRHEESRMVRGYHSNIVSTPSYTPTLCVCARVFGVLLVQTNQTGLTVTAIKKITGLIHKTNCLVGLLWWQIRESSFNLWRQWRLPGGVRQEWRPPTASSACPNVKKRLIALNFECEIPVDFSWDNDIQSISANYHKSSRKGTISKVFSITHPQIHRGRRKWRPLLIRLVLTEVIYIGYLRQEWKQNKL